MIVNPLSILKNEFKCNKAVMEHLVFKCGLSVAGYKGNTYYFIKNKELDKCLQTIPLGIKFLSIFDYKSLVKIISRKGG